MKIKLMILSVVGLMFIGCSSSQEQVNPTPSEYKDGLSYEQQLIIENEVEKRSKAIKLQAELDAKNKYERVIANWKKEIKYFEMGKYAIEKGYVTNPMIVPIVNENGTVTIHNMGCKIQKPLDANDFIDYYSKDESLLQKHTVLEQDFSTHTLVAGVSLPMQTNKPDMHIATMAQESEKEVVIPFKKTYKNTSLLNDYALNYTVKDEDFLVSFKNQDEYMQFCEKSGICEGVTK